MSVSGTLQEATKLKGSDPLNLRGPAHRRSADGGIDGGGHIVCDDVAKQTNA